MEDIAVKRKSMFGRLSDFVGGFFKKPKSENFVEYSRFRQYLNNISKDSQDYDMIESAVNICDEAFLISEKRISFMERLKKIDNEMEALKCYNNLSIEDVSRLKDLLDRFASLSRDRKNLRNQLESFEHSLSFMKDLEEDANKAIPEINNAEEKQRLFKQDLTYLEGEKESLIYEKERLELGLSFVRKFSVVLCVFFVVATAALIAMHVTRDTDILISMGALIGAMVVISVLLYAFVRRVVFELELNVKKQNRAVELINKKTVVYAHYTNFLHYEYKKYKIRNSAMLKDNLDDYGLYKHLTARMDSIRSIMYQTEAEIEEFLKEKDLYNSAITIDKFMHTVDLDDKKNIYRELVNEKKMIENSLIALDSKSEKLYKVLNTLSESDPTEDNLIHHIINSYYDEVNKLMSHFVLVSEG